MSTFRGTDFTIELPGEFSDESTYAFAFPARGNFRPSIVLKTERLAGQIELPVYAAQQLEKLKQALPGVEVAHVGPVNHGGYPAHRSVYDWGEPARRVRQSQRYILLEEPLRVVTLTATTLEATYAQTEALFEAIFDSFQSLNGKGA